MTITIQISTDSAAFEGDNFAPELRVVLMKLVDAMTATQRPLLTPTSWRRGGIRDSNGNSVGTFTVQP